MPSSSSSNIDSHSILHVEEILIQRGGAPRSSLPDHDVTCPCPSCTTCKTLSLGERIQSAKSLLTLTNLISHEETESLVRSCREAAAVISQTKTNGDFTLDQGLQGRAYVRMPTIAAAQRDNSQESLEEALPESISLMLEDILERALLYVDQQLCPSVKETLFGHNSDLDNNDSNDTAAVSLVELFLHNQLDYSTREPAINVYTAPNGHFGLHKDSKALTLLISLSDPDHEYTGGGTAFWSQSYPRDGQDDPAFVLRRNRPAVWRETEPQWHAPEKWDPGGLCRQFFSVSRRRWRRN